ncbi:MAG: hypothetical protein DLM57_03470 [Pseudonocardiales bacterium]|nr:MAG: hypothetical protein DLM57_03470 [Pseudonocardiales bacterium]
MSQLEQLPRLSAYDPGAVGEGGLDPLGLGAIADRIAEILAPGVRARMSQPRFVTLSAVGAIAYQALHDLTADEGKTTVDIAFEWIVVEAIVRNPAGGRTEGLPGNQKALRAKQMNQRLSRRTYLNGPRVFGFTGVYRPFSRNVGVLSHDDLPAHQAERLVGAWERDFDLAGFLSGVAGTPGGRLRKDIADACRRTLERAECAAPPTGQLLRDLSDCLAPREARLGEKRILRDLITTGEHEIRNEITAKLVASPPASGTSQRDLAQQLLRGTSTPTRGALQAAIKYEEAATAIDKTFRRFLAYTAQQHGSIISPMDALRTPGLADLAPRVGALVDRAITAVTALDDVALSNDTADALRLFTGRSAPAELLDALVERHEEVQAGKGKLSWLDQLQGDWTVRIPYRNQPIDLDDKVWTHPMRLTTLANFLAETAA